MLPNLTAIETHAGRIIMGATVRSTRYDVQGSVTAIRWTGYYYSIEVDNRHSDDAGLYELLSAPTYPGFNYVNPNAQQVLSGNFEVLLPGEGDRIYFAGNAAQAVALVAATIGLWDQAHDVAYLTERAEAGPVDELRFRGSAGIVGQLAYVSTRQPRPAPKFRVSDQVQFFAGHPACMVSGLALYKDRLNYGKTEWHYFYAEAKGNHRPISEADTSPAPVPARLAA